MKTLTASKMVAEAREAIENLSVDEVASELLASEPLLVDIRESADLVATGVIPGAVHAPGGMIECYADPASPYHRAEFGPDRRAILYCARSAGSALAVRSLASLGYSNIGRLDDSIKAWATAGQPLQSRWTPA